MLSVEETNAMLEKEFAGRNSKTDESPPKEGESKSLDESMQTSSVLADKSEEAAPDVSTFGSDQRCIEVALTYFPFLDESSSL